MGIDKKYLESRLEELIQRHERTVKDANDSITLTQKLEGAIEMTRGLLQKLEEEVKIEDNKE